MTVEIIFETHSTTIDNEAGLATGWLPGRLSESGRRQALKLGKRHRENHIAAVFVSDLARAVETADIAFSGSGIPIYQDARLRECNYGEFNGISVARLVNERRHYIETPYPGGQSYREVINQTRDFLRDLAAVRDGSWVVIIAHSANRLALDHLLIGTPLEILASARFCWQPGWHYTLPTGWPEREC